MAWRPAVQEPWRQQAWPLVSRQRLWLALAWLQVWQRQQAWPQVWRQQSLWQLASLRVWQQQPLWQLASRQVWLQQ